MTKPLCLIQYHNSGWLLPKGRRHIGESRHAAALREAEEETGFKCLIHPATVLTRALRANDPEDVPDIARLCVGSTEPLLLTVRDLDGGTGIKIIWWYILRLMATPLVQHRLVLPKAMVILEQSSYAKP
ncbi:hypothetical protein BJX63DRAFT_303884 [Aspergillus granulosus]|uniref:Nudix hydrolase domain-containing protein n=1 Tax=Aspergillus granulosus TaxID=176169 RepID=A0ABR4H7E6_9EURO